MNVLVIPEDFTHDQYVLKPMVQAMLTYLGKRSATVRVCTEPRLRGVEQALSWERIQEILERYRSMTDLFLLIVDRDCATTRRAALDGLEAQARAYLPAGRLFFSEHAWQEVEVWALAGQELPGDWRWLDVRSERDPKEKYFLPLAKQRGLLDEPGEGRKTLGREAAARYDRVRRLCSEDVAALEERVAAAIK